MRATYSGLLCLNYNAIFDTVCTRLQKLHIEKRLHFNATFFLYATRNTIIVLREWVYQVSLHYLFRKYGEWLSLHIF